MTVLPNTGMTLPVRGAPGSGLWGDTIDANLAILDVMDHTPGHGPLVPVAGLNINADLPFSSLWAPTQLHRVQFSNIAAGALTAGQRKSLYASDGTSGGVANELYWINNAGNKVQITSGNTLNFAAFVGGIGGDYTSVGATLNYNDGQKAYEFKEGAIDANGWARLRCGDLRLFPFNTTGATYVGMAAPAGIGGTYTVTWPLALPGSTVLQQIDSTGQSIFSNALASNQSITLSGTGVIKHGTYTRQIASSAFASTSASVAWNTSGLTGAPLNCISAISIAQGKRITAIRVFILDSVTGPTKLQASFITTAPDGTVATVASSAVSAGSGAAQTLSIAGLTTTVAANLSYSIVVSTTTGVAATVVRFAEVDYDRP